MPNSRSQGRSVARRILTRYAATLAIFTLVITSSIFYAVNVNAAGGDVDASFNTGAGADNIVFAIAVQPDGKVIIGGDFTTVGGAPRTRIARLNADGTIDTSFNPSAGANGSVFAVRVQPDGKIVIGGSFTLVGGAARSGIARLNTDGSLDTSFNPGTGASSGVFAVAIDRDGKIIIGGQFSNVNNVARSRVARLNTDGSVDTSFDTSVGANDLVLAVATQPDGKVLIGGDFTIVNGETRTRIARLNTDGGVDTSFDTSVGANNRVRAIAIQPDGKIIIGGFLSAVNNVARNRIARLNTSGTVDDSFNASVGTGAFDNVLAIAASLDGDGKIVIGGFFSMVGGVARNRVARLNSDGGVDTSFDTSTGANNTVYAVAVQPDGQILIGGDFTAVNGVTRTRIARLDGSIFVTPVADTWVQGADAFRDTNYGTSAELQVKRTLNAGAGRGRRGFLRFDTSNVEGTVASAKLRIYARLTVADLPPTSMIVQKVTDTTWNELTVTWNNQPGVESFNPLAQITVTGATGQYYEFDLTTFIQQERAAGRNAVSFRLINGQATGTSGTSFTTINSKEAAVNRPQLVITAP